MNATTVKLLLLLGMVSCILLKVNARVVEQPWEYYSNDYDDDRLGYDDDNEREVRQPLRYGKRTLNHGGSSEGHFHPPPYHQGLNKGKK